MNSSAPILIAAINARHSHASLGARYLLANMGELRAQTELAEFTIQQSAAEIAAVIAAQKPQILGLGVYIWNAARVAELLPLLRHKSPEIKIVLGGPEIADSNSPVGTEPDPPSILEGRPPCRPLESFADVLLHGEGDLAFPALCRDILASHPCPSVSIRG